MDTSRHQELNNFLLKCNDVLSQFKKKRRDNFLQRGDTYCDEHVARLLSLTSRVEDELRSMSALEDTHTIDTLYKEYENLHEPQDELIDSLKQEYENMDKESWYNQQFDNWKTMPERQDCESHSLRERLHYSKCRRKMFDHLESEWKKRTFPTLHDRLEFF